MSLWPCTRSSASRRQKSIAARAQTSGRRPTGARAPAAPLSARPSAARTVLDGPSTAWASVTRIGRRAASARNDIATMKPTIETPMRIGDSSRVTP